MHSYSPSLLAAKALLVVRFLVFVSLSLWIPVTVGADDGTDIRVLIDISGSMKKNDPGNLRVPAVNLLTELVPDGNTAGVWTFGQYVNMLVKHDKVDAAWRKGAKEKAKQINSVALYTNIGGVLEKAADDFKGDRKFPNTHFILLTDGMVDIDQDPQVNAKERQRILESVAQKIKSRGAKIHTVALSKNADKALLDKLALATGGNSAIAETPEALSKVFLQTLDRAVPVEQVPLEGNTFAIDSSVEEFTALIFRQPGSQSTKLVGPDEKVYGVEQQGQFLKWYQDQGYDLITVLHPLEGTWKVQADMAPESRVTVVSNLRMNVSRLPANFYSGDVLDVEVSFEEDGTRVTNKDFLSLMEVLLRLTTEEKKSGTKTLSDPAKVPADGVFRDTISKLTREGPYEVDVLVDGKTFQRKHRQVITLRSPLDIELAASGYDEQTRYDLIITPRNEKIDLAATSIATKIKAPDGSSIIRTVPLNPEKKRWEMQVEAAKGDGTYEISLKVKGVNQDGNEFKFLPRSFEAVFPRSPADANQYVSLSETPKELQQEEPAETPVIPPPIEIPPVLEQDELPPAEDSDLLMYGAIGGGVLAVLLLAGGLAWWFMKRRKAANADQEEFDAMSDEELTAGVFDDVPAEPVMDDVPDSLDFVEEVPQQDREPVKEDTFAELDSFGEMTMTAEVEDPVPVLDGDTSIMDLGDDDIPVVSQDMAEADDLKFDPDATVVAEVAVDEIAEVDLDEVIDGKSAEDLADEILADNSKADDFDDEEFNLEDFDIADTEDLDGLTDKKT